MADSEKRDAGSSEESQASGPCWDFEKMSKMMQNCCGGEGSFDFKEMMQRMSGCKPKQSTK
jgi:hypothetical protein